MYEILKAISLANLWVFDYGRADFHNLKDISENKNTPHIFLDPVKIKKMRNDMGVVEKIEYSGTYMCLYSSDIDELDYETRYNNYIKPVMGVVENVIENELRCIYGANFMYWEITEVINIFDYNFDGVICSYQIAIDIDTLELSGIEYELTTTAGNGGEVSPELINEKYGIGSIVAICATPDTGNQFENFQINGVENTDNPIMVKMYENINVVASFITKAYNTFMDLFTTEPIYNESTKLWEAVNNNGSIDNKGLYNNQTVGFFSNTTVISHNTINYSDSPKFKGIFKFNKSRDQQTIIGRMTGGNEYYFYIVGSATASPSLRLRIYPSATEFIVSFLIPIQEWVELYFDVDNNTKTIKIGYTNIITGITEEEGFVLIDDILNLSTDTTIGGRGISATSLFMNALCAMYDVNNGECIVYFNKLNGIDVYDSSGNNNHGFFAYSNLETFYSNTDKLGIIEPYAYTEGCSVFSDDTEPENSDKYVIVVYDVNGIPVLSELAGFTKIGDFPSGSGLINGLSNTIEFNNSAELIAFSENYPFFETLIPYSFEQIKSWGTNQEIVKVENNDNIYQLELKK